MATAVNVDDRRNDLGPARGRRRGPGSGVGCREGTW